MKALLILLTALLLQSCAVAQDYRIMLSPSSKFYNGDTVFYQSNDINSSNQVNQLIDEQNADPFNKLVPTTTFESGPIKNMWYPATMVLDLGGTYQISHEYFYTVGGTDVFCMQYGEPMNWNSDTLKSRTDAAGWLDFNRTITTRYLKIFYMNTGYQKVREIALYGHLVGDSLSRVKPLSIAPTKTDLTMGQFIGFNQVGPKEVDSVGSVMRHYDNQYWLDTVTTEHDINKIKFVFSIFGHFNSNTDSDGSTNYFFPEAPPEAKVKTGLNLSAPDYHNMALNGVGYFDVIQGSPKYAGSSAMKAIDRVNHTDPTAPQSYDRLARMMWNYAAHYGFVKHNPDSIQTPYPNATGLGLGSWVESGNEMNQDWSSREKHYTPREFIAYSSAFYDGNSGQMGDRMGVKNADPNMKVLQAGTAGAHPEYLKGMHYYIYYTRKNHSVPFDALNFHSYPTNGSNGKGSVPNAMSPENYFLMPNNPIKDYVKQAGEMFPGMPVWLTEWGYDRNSRSTLSVPPVQGKDSAAVQADFIARFWFMLSFTGVKRATIFQLTNDALKTMYDTLGYTVFNTSGLTDGHYVGNAYSRDFAKSFYAFPAYYFQRTIWLKLFDYKPDQITVNNQDSLYVYKYRNAIHPDSVAYVVWSGTQSNRTVGNMLLTTGNPNTEISLTELKDKYFTGIATDYKTDSAGNLALIINETPKLIFTTDGKGGRLISNQTKPIEPMEPVEPPQHIMFKGIQAKDGNAIIIFQDETGKQYQFTISKK